MTMTSEQSSSRSSPSGSVEQLTADPSASTDDDLGSSASSNTPPPHSAEQHHQHTQQPYAQHHIRTAADTLSVAAAPFQAQLHSPPGQPLPPALSSPFPAAPVSGAFNSSETAVPFNVPPGLDGVMRDLSALSISSQPTQPQYHQQPQPPHVHHHQQQQQHQQQLAVLQQYMLQQQQHMQQLATAAYIYQLHYQHHQPHPQHQQQQPQHSHLGHSAIPAAHYPLQYPHMSDQQIQHLLANQPSYPTVPIPPFLTSTTSAPATASLSPLTSPLSAASSMSSSLSSPFPRTKLIVRYLPPTLSPAAFHSLFQSFGRLLSSNLIMSRSQPQMSLCYGFLLYTTEAEARECRRHMNGRRIEGRVIEVEECKGSKEGRNGEKRVIRITGWKGRPSEADVRRRVEMYGEVESVAVTADESAANSGDGGGEVSVVVKFAQSASAYRCIEAMHNAHVGDAGGSIAGATGAGGSVSVKFHDAAHRGRQSHRLNSAGRSSRGGGGASGGAGSGAGAGNTRTPRQRPTRRSQDEQWMGNAAVPMWSMDGALPAHMHEWSMAAAAVQQQHQQQGEAEDISAIPVEGGTAAGAPQANGSGASES